MDLFGLSERELNYCHDAVNMELMELNEFAPYCKRYKVLSRLSEKLLWICDSMERHRLSSDNKGGASND